MERYEAYKDSGVEWIGEIPERWKTVPLARCITRTGNGITRRGDYCDDGLVVLKLRNIADGSIDYSYQNRMALTHDEQEAFALNKGDFLFVRVNGSRHLVGKCAIFEGAPEPVAYNDHIIRIAFDKARCSARFLLWFFQSESSRCELDLRVKTSAGQYTVSSDDIKACIFALPPQQEQQNIADYLDNRICEIDALIADCEREVELLQEYRKAVITEAVTKGLDPDAPMKDSGIAWIGKISQDWEVVGLKTYLDSIVDYRGRTPEKVDEGVFLITGRNIKQGRVHYELSQEYMRPEDFDDIMSRGKLRVGNVLFTMEAPLGEVALIDRDDCAAAQRIVQFCCNENELLGAYLVYWIMSDGFQSDLQTYATGSTASGIKASKLGKLRLIHPPLDTQRSIVAYLDAKTAEIDSLIDAKQSMADKLREYRKSLISEAVTGKFKVPGI